MTISSVEQMWSRQTGMIKSSDGQNFTATYSSTYQVEHSVGEAVTTIQTANDGTTAVPVIGDPYPNTSGVFCTTMGKVQTVGPVFSLVTVDYEGQTGSANPLDDPLSKPPEIDYQARTVTEAIDTDINGVSLTNSIGDLVHGITDDIWDYELTIRRNFAVLNTFAWRLYARSYSSDTFFDWPAGTASLKQLRARPVVSGGVVSYFDVMARVAFREPYNTINSRAWWKRYRNEGYNSLFGTCVSFSAPSGSGTRAMGYANANDNGQITSVTVTHRGSGYTSAPGITFVSDDGGAGAVAAAALGTGSQADEVVDVTIQAGGMDYKTGKHPAVDGTKSPVTTPVALKADGTPVKDESEATWIERPTKNALPYQALGLL